MLTNALFVPERGFAALQYLGQHGISARCLEAVRLLLQWNQPIRQALILTCEDEHAFLFTLGHEFDEIVIVKAGFSSGYGGEGPRTLAEALNLLRAFGVDIEEAIVSRKLMHRLANSALTVDDLKDIDKAGVVRPMRWFEFIYPWRERVPKAGQRLKEFAQLMPWAVIDQRIEDLAHRFFENEDDCIGKGFRRLEDCIRARTGLLEHGAKLMQQAFMRDEPLLTWSVSDNGEQKGRAQIFVGTSMAFRNPRAHRESPPDGGQGLGEFLLLNQLFLLEGQALAVSPSSS